MAAEAKAIRKRSAQYDLFHRLHSINADRAFVQLVADRWYGKRFEVVPNQRCGNWYCDPSASSSVYAYFKSTDGHTNQWDFNLRRSNLSLAKYAEERGGIILVDSTRRGKRMPDALSKTVPIWCAVINRALLLRAERSGPSSGLRGWDVELYLPPNIVSPSEKAQIEAKLGGWAMKLESSALPLPTVSKPLRPFFIHPSTSTAPLISGSSGFTPIICLSASRWVDSTHGDEVPSSTRIPKSGDSATVGFEYVPGAGDDDELWARGLKPALFHSRLPELLCSPREGLHEFVDSIVSGQQLLADLTNEFQKSGTSASPSISRITGPTSVPSSSSRLALDLGPAINGEVNPLPGLPGAPVVFYVASMEKVTKDHQALVIADKLEASRTFFLAMPPAKTNPSSYTAAIEGMTRAVRQQLHMDASAEFLLRPGRRKDYEILLGLEKTSRSTDTDVLWRPDDTPLTPDELIETRRTIIPVALVLLCSFPQLSSRIMCGDLGQVWEPPDGETPTKASIAKYLHSLVALWPDGNPPRAALKRVHEYLMSDRRG